MAAYQARGIFVGLDAATLASMRAAALARIGGQVVTSSEAGQSFSRSVGMAPDEVLIEVNYATQLATGTLPPTRTRPNYGGLANEYGSGCGAYPDPSRSDFI